MEDLGLLLAATSAYVGGSVGGGACSGVGCCVGCGLGCGVGLHGDGVDGLSVVTTCLTRVIVENVSTLVVVVLFSAGVQTIC